MSVLFWLAQRHLDESGPNLRVSESVVKRRLWRASWGRVSLAGVRQSSIQGEVGSFSSRLLVRSRAG